MKKIETQLASVRNSFLEIRKKSVQLNPKNRKEVSKLVSLLNEFSFKMGKISNLTSVIFSNKNIKKFGESAVKKIHKFKLSAGRDLNLNLLSESEFYFDQMYNEIEKEILKIVLEPVITESDSKYLKEEISSIESKVENLERKISSIKDIIADLVYEERENVLKNDELSALEKILLLHDEGMKWIEPRFLSNDPEILEKLYDYGLLKRKKRGGINVYAYRKN